ncbi:hypothetical protein C8R44DRAFT_893572 [Mycena epipterygia]|nr:hypothetical protein C8R44DRAFT_893572 [Mycena epipterygia]
MSLLIPQSCSVDPNNDPLNFRMRDDDLANNVYDDDCTPLKRQKMPADNERNVTDGYESDTHNCMDVYSPEYNGLDTDMTPEEFDAKFWGTIQKLADAQAVKFRYLDNVGIVDRLDWESWVARVQSDKKAAADAAVPVTSGTPPPKTDDWEGVPYVSASNQPRHRRLEKEHAVRAILDRRGVHHDRGGDPYRSVLVTVIYGNFKQYRGMITSTHPDGQVVDIRLDAKGNAQPIACRLEHVVEQRTGWSLDFFRRSSAAEIEAQRSRLEALASRAEPPRSRTPPPAGRLAKEWPEVAEPDAVYTPAVVETDIAAGNIPGPPYAIHQYSDGNWLRLDRLRGVRLNVVIQSAGVAHRGRYDGEVGTIRRVPVMRPDDRAVADVFYGPEYAEAHRSFRTKFLQPAHTTRDAANTVNSRPLLKAPGVGVIIIGPDCSGSFQYIGQYDWVMRGGQIYIPNIILSFPLSSVCRSENNVDILAGGTGGRWVGW